MPTDAATEAVEHVRNLASERREVCDPAELIDDVARIGARRFCDPARRRPRARPRAGSPPDGDTPARPFSRRRRGPTAAAPPPRMPRPRRLAWRLTYLGPPGGGGCPRRASSTAEEDLGVHAQR